jgi:hypothetical protein
MYIDDLCVLGKTWQDHLENLRAVFERLESANLRLKLAKCKFGRRVIPFLGYIVSGDGLQINPEKSAAIRDYPPPATLKALRSWIGLVSYLRRFVSRLSHKLIPLHQCATTTNVKANWTEECQRAFLSLKEELMSPRVLSHPDFALPFRVTCDASNVGLGGLMSQVKEGVEYPISYISPVLHPAERKWHTTDRELEAVVWALKKFKAYIEGTGVEVVTDHQALTALYNRKEPSDRVARRLEFLSRFDLQIVHRKGSENKVADALSGHPVEGSEMEKDWLGQEEELMEKKDAGMQDNKDGQPEESETRASVLELLVDHEVLSKVGAMQRSDPTIRPWIEYLEDGTLLEDEKEAHRIVTEAREMTFDEDHRLYLVWHGGPFAGQELRKRLVVPQLLRQSVLLLGHDDRLAGHMGVDRTYRRLRPYYFWPRMLEEVEQWVTACETCARTKPPRTPPKGLLHGIPPPSRPMELVAVDAVGPLKRAADGNRYILVWIDHFSKFLWLHALSEFDGETTARALISLASQWGRPEKLLFSPRLFFLVCGGLLPVL